MSVGVTDEIGEILNQLGVHIEVKSSRQIDDWKRVQDFEG